MIQYLQFSMKPFGVIQKFISELGLRLIFLGQIIKTLFVRPCSAELIINQIWSVSMQSLPTTAFAGFFVGAIMAVQFGLQMKEFGTLGFLGGLATSGTIREVGPLLIGFMLSGKVGAFTSAELGTMRVTEQIDAIRCLGADPLQEVILPRFLGIVISSFMLLTAGLVMSIFGGIFLGVLFAGVEAEEYVRHIPTIVAWPSVLTGLIKCFFFSMAIALVSTYQGYHTTGGAKGVGRTVVLTAVSTMILIVLLDWFTSYLFEASLVAIQGYR